MKAKKEPNATWLSILGGRTHYDDYLQGGVHKAIGSRNIDETRIVAIFVPLLVV
jgi:hypothetical protein